MKKRTNIIVILMLLITLLLPSMAFAHPPQDMVLEYDIDTEILSVTITHNSPGPTVHYVNKIEIKQNDNLIITEEYDSQPTTSEYTYTYDVQAEVGDELTVIAYCNIQGSITRSITVRNPSQDEPPVVEIVNPTEGYFHFSGIRLFPSSGIIADTLGFGGFRLQPLKIYTEDDFDDSSDLIVTVLIDEEQLGTASYNDDAEVHEIKWTGPNLGTFTLSVTAEDSLGNIGRDEMQVWYFCFIP
ncbi:MAG: hypothetical protein KGY67_08520 [Candidatus Thermoplasmatota archaeon]|nr:hypothetical protein [Candidatus Thermoplasmatota archaeon]